MFILTVIFIIFIGEIERIDPLLNGGVPAPSHLLSGTSLNGTSMNKTHGMTNTSLFNRWCGIKQRCSDKNADNFERYGKRGIKICNQWKCDFVAFHDYVMALPNAMKEGYSIDRIDNDGNYEPGNIQWSNSHTQTTNTRRRKNKTGYTGVIHDKLHGKIKYRAVININKKFIRIGWFNTIKEALDARNKYIIENDLTEYRIQEYGNPIT